MIKTTLRTRLFTAGFLLPLLSFAAPKPNIILIYTDDHGWPDIGAAGIYDDLKTPHIDALAQSGVRATSGYSTAPQCVPSRAGLLTGKSQNRFGVEGNGNDLRGFDAEHTIAERLKKAGYATGQIGKWHLGPNPAIPSHGFDDVYSKNANRPCHANFTLDGKTVPMGLDTDTLYHLDACSEAALAFIGRHADEPFFLYLAYRAPHVPLDAPKKYLNRFPGKMPERRRQCLAMLSSMDDGIGKIRSDLSQRGLLNNTLFFYIGDNGAPLKITKLDAPGGGPGWDGSLNEPMNGEKGMLSEGGIRVPFLVSWPGTIPGEQVIDTPLISLDVAATAVALAGLDPDPTLDGQNIVPFLSGKAEAPQRALYWRWIAQAAVRDGRWKFLRGGQRDYLFNLEEDMGETKNLLAEYPEVASRLKSQLEKWAADMQPPGLTTKGMSSVWENYFDHYLDGNTTTPPPAEPPTIKNWIARNSTANIQNGALHIVPGKGAKQRPFIACAGLSIPSPTKATITLRSEHGGEVGFAWRLKDQGDFVPGQSITTNLPASKEWQTIDLDIPGKDTIIHLRTLLPNGTSDIKQISLSKQSWNFQ
jgi:uncharacterized sulfatase